MNALDAAVMWGVYVQGFYLPGVAPRAFKDGEAVQMKVQTLVSTETPLQVTNHSAHSRISPYIQ